MGKSQRKCNSRVKVLFVVPLKQKCPHLLKRKVIETCTCRNGRKQRKHRKSQTSGYTVPKHTRLTKRARKHMMYNYRKNRTSVEQRMQKIDRQVHEQLQKTIFGHTRRTISKIINVKPTKSINQMSIKYQTGQKISKVDDGKISSCRIPEEIVNNLQRDDSGNACWLCDKVDGSGTRQIECDKCCIWFHINCTHILTLTQLLNSDTFCWICCKCGHANYCDTLFDKFGISRDENMFDLLYTGVDQCIADEHVEELSAKKKEGTDSVKSEAENGYVNLNSMKQSLKQQTGGYFLRKKKSNLCTSNHLNVSGNSNSEGKANNEQTPSKVPSKKCEKSLSHSDKMVKKKTQSMSVNNMKEGKKCSNVGEQQHSFEFYNKKKRSLELNDDKVNKYAKVTHMECSNVQGHFHQGHLKFGVNTGKQCVANCLCAMMYSQVKELQQWTSYDMDLVLNSGDELYGHLSKSTAMNNDYLLINELPDELIAFKKSYTMTYHESVTGMFEDDDDNLAEFNMMQLNRALEQTLQRYNACFVCFNVNTFGVIAQDGVYYIFDSHSRDDNGWQVQDGRSLLKFTPTWQDVYRYCTELRTSMNLHNNEQFEITGVTLCQDDDATTCLCRGEEVDEQQKPDQICDLNMCDMTKEVPSELSSDKEGNDIKDCKPSCDCSGDLTDTCTCSKTHVDLDTNIDDICADSSGIEMTIVSEPCGFKFIPLSYEHKKCLCKSLGFGRVYSQSVVFEECERIGHPEHLRNIQGDGNFFFRAVSFAISGTERNHMRLRLATVNHLLKHASRYNTYLREGFSDVEGYIGRQRMFCSGVWATEVEMMAVAHMLETDIYTFGNTCRWYIFSGKMAEIGSVTSDAGIYLNHSHGIHYDVVLSVHKLPLARSVIEEHSIDLAGCDVSNIINTQNESIGNADNNNEVGGDCNEQVDVDNCINKQMKPLKGKKRKRKVSAAMRRKLDRENKRKKRSEDKNNNEDFHDEDHEMVIKTNKKQYKNMKYQLNILHKQRQINAMKTKYHEDSVCRERKNSGLKTKYHEDSVCRERKKSGLKTKYHEDSMCRERKKSGLKTKYYEDSVCRERKKSGLKTKYYEDSI